MNVLYTREEKRGERKKREERREKREERREKERVGRPLWSVSKARTGTRTTRLSDQSSDADLSSLHRCCSVLASGPSVSRAPAGCRADRRTLWRSISPFCGWSRCWRPEPWAPLYEESVASAFSAPQWFRTGDRRGRRVVGSVLPASLCGGHRSSSRFPVSGAPRSSRVALENQTLEKGAD